MNEGTPPNGFAGARALRQLREQTDAICDVTALAAVDEFRVEASTVDLGAGVLAHSRVGAVQYDRTPQHIARSGVDHYQVTLCFDDLEFSSGRRTIALKPGDVFLVDMAQANRARMGGAGHDGFTRCLSLILPRPRLAPLLASPDAAAASFWAGGSGHGRLLAEQLLALYGRGGQFAAGEGAAAVDGLACLVADAAGQRPDAGIAIARAKGQALLASIKGYIDANLHDERLSAEGLWRRFQISRATLYRLFEREGGLSRHIQERRLDRAFTRLISPRYRKTRMIDHALDSHFGSDATFVRAFRRRFGLTPGAVRRLAAASERLGGDAVAWPWCVMPG
jgi:AraC-like DNA-binding protein